jgi:hypothetical protein
MALFTEANVRQRGRVEVAKRGHIKKADQIILDSVLAHTGVKTYDIFLSHSVRDAELILGMKGTFEDLGYSVYVDWIEDPSLDRSNVSAATAQKLRSRMQSSRSLFYVTTSNATTSRWMPWECGYFDGSKEKVAIAPIQAASTDNKFSGQEYLGLYPYVVQQQNTQNKDMLWIRTSSSRYVSYDHWLATPSAKIEWKEG